MFLDLFDKIFLKLYNVYSSVVSFFTVAHNIYGVPQTINSANYVYFLGLEKVLQLDHPESTKVFTGIHALCQSGFYLRFLVV